jgi:uncharacterized protein YegP (UPF0339 family)
MYFSKKITMTHAVILKSKSKKNPFKVRVVGGNGEILMTSETLSTRSNCIKNLLATMKCFNGEMIRVKDITRKSRVDTYDLNCHGAKLSI